MYFGLVNLSIQLYMKRIILLLILLSSTGMLSAQDIIVMKKGPQVQAKIIEITANDVKYKRFNNLDGPTITTPKSEIFLLRYQDGRRISFDAPAPTPVPVTPETQKPVPDRRVEQEEMDAKARQLKEEEARKQEEIKKSEESAAKKRQEQMQEKQKVNTERPTEQERIDKTKAEMDRKAGEIQSENVRKKDFPGELEFNGGITIMSIETNQYQSLQSFDASANKYKEAWVGSNALLSTQFGILYRKRIVGAWFWFFGANFNKISVENEFKSTLPSEPEYLSRYYLNNITTIGLPLGTTINLGNKNRGKFFIEGGILTHLSIEETDELYPVVYDKPESEANFYSGGFYMSPFAGLGIKFKLSNRVRLNWTNTWYFSTLGSMSSAEGVEKSMGGMGSKIGLAIGIGQSPE